MPCVPPRAKPPCLCAVENGTDAVTTSSAMVSCRNMSVRKFPFQIRNRLLLYPQRAHSRAWMLSFGDVGHFFSFCLLSLWFGLPPACTSQLCPTASSATLNSLGTNSQVGG